MSRIYADKIQKGAGGTALTLPATDGVNGQYLQTDGVGNLQWTNVIAPPLPVEGLVAPEGRGIFGSIMSHSDRGNNYNNQWTSGGPWTTYTHRDAHTDNHLIQFMTMALGDGLGASGTSQYMYGNDAEQQKSRRLLFSTGQRLGVMRDSFQYNNNTSTPGIGMQIMPLRNPTGAGISVPIIGLASDYWSAGNEGSCLFVLEPNTSTYSTVTSVNSSRLAFSNNSTRQNSLTGSYTIPAGRTVLVCLGSTDQYQTTYRFKDTNYFRGLDAIASTGAICDMRMLSNLARGRINLTYAGAAAGILPAIWTNCASTYGDR
jgi:hypothetical protein